MWLPTNHIARPMTLYNLRITEGCYAADYYNRVIQD